MGAINISGGSSVSELSTSISGNLVGPTATATAYTIQLRKTGNICHISCRGTVDKAAAATPEVFTHSGTALSSDYRPAPGTVDFPILVKSADVVQWGIFRINTSGVITIYADTSAGSFGTTGNNGIPLFFNASYITSGN